MAIRAPVECGAHVGCYACEVTPRGSCTEHARSRRSTLLHALEELADHEAPAGELVNLVTPRVGALDGVTPKMSCPVVHLYVTDRRAPLHHDPGGGRGRRPGGPLMGLA